MYIYLNESKPGTDVKLWLLYSNTWNHLTAYKKNELRLVLKCYQQNVFTNHIHFYIYIYERERRGFFKFYSILILREVWFNGISTKINIKPDIQWQAGRRWLNDYLIVVVFNLSGTIDCKILKMWVSVSKKKKKTFFFFFFFFSSFNLEKIQ